MLLLRLLIAASLCLAGNAARAACQPGLVEAMPERATIHLPAGQAQQAPMPLMILLHGSTGTGAWMLQQSGLAATADRHGFIVAAPDGGIATAGGGFVWNIPGVPAVDGTMPPPTARDDVAYLTDLADRLVRTGCVDGTRIYVTGFSGGARMTSLLGCVAAERFAAIAPVAGLRAGRPLAAEPTRADPTTCRPAAPLPILTFAGDADTTNPSAGGGAPYWQYGQDAALQRWAVLNGCTRPYARELTATVYEQGYASCRDGATLAARVTRGGQHSWAVADNEALWAFLSQHRR
jgi:polyhydroxybutyrate depolymerase